VPWRARDVRPILLRRRASRPQLKRDPLGSATTGRIMERRDFLRSAALGSIGAPFVRPDVLDEQEVSWPYDGAGTIARLGVLTPDFDPVPESELWAMAPRGVSIHTARVPRAGGRGAGLVSAPYIDDAVDCLVELAPRAILLGYTSSSYALGADADEVVRTGLEQRTKGVPVIFTAPVAVAALRQLAVRRVSIVHPPWWTTEANDQGLAYWRAAGFEVLDCTRLTPERTFSEVAVSEVFDFIAGRTPRVAEAVFIGGNGMRTIGAIRALEARLGRPVVAANQVLLWNALGRLQTTEAITQYGSIFARRPSVR
jgi:maleate isomerase